MSSARSLALLLMLVATPAAAELLSCEPDIASPHVRYNMDRRNDGIVIEVRNAVPPFGVAFGCPDLRTPDAPADAGHRVCQGRGRLDAPTNDDEAHRDVGDTHTDFPLARWLDLEPFWLYEICFRGQRDGQVSETCSNSIFVCWPPNWCNP